MGSGWMSVICAEFIATSAGFGYLMVEAQMRLETDTTLCFNDYVWFSGFCHRQGFYTARKQINFVEVQRWLY